MPLIARPDLAVPLVLLCGGTFLPGGDIRLLTRKYSIADIAIWPWVSRYEWQTVDLNAYPNVKRWYKVIAKRPTVQRGYKVPKDVGEIPMP